MQALFQIQWQPLVFCSCDLDVVVFLDIEGILLMIVNCLVSHDNPNPFLDQIQIP